MSWTLDAEQALGNSLRIRRFIRSNGLRLVLLCDPAAPVFSYQTWYDVGSRDEQVGATGMAHFFEHLMFGETSTHPEGEFDRLIEEVGGDNNAATWTDWTSYRTSLPSKELDLAVRLESDRMRNLTLSDEQLRTEREVVMSERRERVDDDIDGLLDEQLNALAYRVHPYRWPTIGWMEDIHDLAKVDVQRFYDTFYAPNNATIVLVGDVDEARALDAIARHYGDIPASARPERAAIQEPEQTQERHMAIVRPVNAERLVAGYKIPGQGHPDWAVLDFISALLCGGPSSRLYHKLVVDLQMATSIDCGVTPFRDPTLFRISLNMTRDNTAADALQKVDETLAQLVERRIDDAELTKVKNGVETDFWIAMEDCDGKADSLGHYEATLGDFRELFHIAERLAAVTADDIRRVANTYLQPERRSVVVAHPSGSNEEGPS